MYLNDTYTFRFFNNPTNEIKIMTISKKIMSGVKIYNNRQIPIYEDKTLYLIDEEEKNERIIDNSEYNKIYIPKDVLLTSTSLEQAVNLVQSKTK